jgi:glycosyltransferase involved in cell wall biosynthesis
MRIAIVSCLYHPHHVGGAERSAQRIAEGLAAHGHEVLAITLDPRADMPIEQINGVRVARLRLPNLYWPFPQRRRPIPLKMGWHAIDILNPVAADGVGQLLREFRPEIVQTHNLTGFSTAVWPTIERLGIPIIHVLHDYYLLCTNSTMVHRGICHHGRHGWCQYVRALQRRQSRAVGTVVGVSQFVLDTHVQAGVFSNAGARLVINNGYDLPPARKPAIADRLNRVQAGPLKVGYLGQLLEVKGLGTLLGAMANLPLDQFTLSIAGTGEESYVQRLKKSCLLSNVRFLGKVDPGEFLSQLDILCVPSIWHDPLPTVVFEAYAHGVPVVGSRMGGITEMIEDGVTGRLVPAGDEGALARALAEFVARSAMLPEMRKNAFNKSREYTVARNVSGYIQLHDGPLHSFARTPFPLPCPRATEAHPPRRPRAPELACSRGAAA